MTKDSNIFTLFSGKHEKKTGYEEALGISTPSKEVI